MRNIGHVPPALLAESPTGLIHFVPDSLKDERAKDNLANTARLICVGYEVTAAVLVLEAWMKMAKSGETLDMTGPPSEAFDRREVVVLTGETAQHSKQRLLPIIRTDAGGFFGLGEHDGPKLHNFEGRFAQLLPPKRPGAEGRELARAMLAAMGGRLNQPQLTLPFKVAGYLQAGQELLALWESTPDVAENDRAIVDGWAEKLGIAGWYQWVPYSAPK